MEILAVHTVKHRPHVTIMERATQPTVAATVLAIGLVLIVLLVHHTISDQRAVNTVGRRNMQ